MLFFSCVRLRSLPGIAGHRSRWWNNYIGGHKTNQDNQRTYKPALRFIIRADPPPYGQSTYGPAAVWTVGPKSGPGGGREAITITLAARRTAAVHSTYATKRISQRSLCCQLLCKPASRVDAYVRPCNSPGEVGRVSSALQCGT